MKYVVIRLKQGSILRDVPIIFPDSLVHADIAKAVQGVIGGEPIAAGQMSSLDLDPECYGRSDTLRLSSRGDRDSELIQTMDYCHGLLEDV